MFSNLKIGARLGLGFGVILFIFATAVVISSLLLNTVGNSTTQVADETLPFLMEAYEMDVNITKVSEALTDVSATHNTEGLKEAEKNAAQAKKGMAKFKEMFRNENDAKSLKEIEELEVNFNKYYEDAQKMAQVYLSKGMVEGNKLMVEMDKTREKLLGDVEKFQQQQVEEAKMNVRNVQSATSNVQKTVYLTGFLSI